MALVDGIPFSESQGGRACTGSGQPERSARYRASLFIFAVVLIVCATLFFYGLQPASDVHADTVEFEQAIFSDCVRCHIECDSCHGWLTEERFAALDHSRHRDHKMIISEMHFNELHAEFMTEMHLG